MTTRYYDRQPEVLPTTLPAGTRYRTSADPLNEFRFTTQAEMAVTPLGAVCYSGPIIRCLTSETIGHNGMATPGIVDWSTVPIPAPETPAELSGQPKCACGCGLIADAVYDCEGIPGLAPYHGELYAKACRARTGLVGRIHDRRSAKGSTAEPGGFTCHGCSRRFDGIELHRMDHDYCGECFSIALKGSEPELDCRCGHAGCSRCDKPTDAPPCSTPACAARGVAATNDGRCVYCDYATDEGRTSQVDRDAFARCATDTNPRRDKLAAERLAAWERAEKPRGNPAEAAMLSKPHPWEEFE